MEQAFPASVMALENGHRPVFPGLVRVAELHLLDAGRSLPNWLQAIFHPIAQRYRAYAGDIRVQHGPATALGLLALATLLWATFTTWRDRTIQTRLGLPDSPWPGSAWVSRVSLFWAGSTTSMTTRTRYSPIATCRGPACSGWAGSWCCSAARGCCTGP